MVDCVLMSQSAIVAGLLTAWKKVGKSKCLKEFKLQREKGIYFPR